MSTAAPGASDDGVVFIVEGALDSAFTGERLERHSGVYEDHLASTEDSASQ
jgi:hypothetical protein